MGWTWPVRWVRWFWQRHYGWWLLTNLALAAIVALWLFWDARFEASLDWWRFQSLDDMTLQYHAGDWWWLRLRNGSLMALVVVAGITAMVMALEFLFGSPANRSLRSGISVMAMIAIWLAIGTHWEDIVWQGKQYRLNQILDEFQAVTQPLRQHWPQQDGDLGEMGPFMAYPVGRPRTLLMLTLPQLKQFPGSFASVEGEPGGPYRFELVDQEEGDWLEWHPVDSYPDSFIGGLGDIYRLKKSHPLKNQWHLARYDH